MTRHFKAFLFDVDKTLTNSKRQVSSFTCEMLEKTAQEGYPVGVCSGRHYATLHEHYFSLFPHNSLHVVSGGAQVIDAMGKVYWEQTITPKVALAVISKALEENLQVYAQTDKQIYAQNRTISYAGLKPSRKLPTFDEITNWHIPIITVYAYSLPFLSFLNTQEVSYKKLTNYEGIEYLDITTKGVSKKTGVEKWCEFLHLKPSEVVGFGDSDNDLEFLQTVGYRVVVSNATASVLAIADEVAASNDDDGVAHWLEEHIIKRKE